MVDKAHDKTEQIGEKIVAGNSRLYQQESKTLIRDTSPIIDDLYTEDYQEQTPNERLQNAKKDNKLVKLSIAFSAVAVICNNKSLDRVNKELDEVYISNYEYMSAFFYKHGVDLSTGNFTIDKFLNKFDRRAYDLLKDKTHIEKNIVSVVQNMVKQGKGIEDIKRQIKIEFFKQNNSAKNIAFTEVGRVQNGSRFDSFISAYDSGLIIDKMWKHSGAAKEPRWQHVNMSGETVPLDKPFSNGGMYPLDPSLPASEVCYCHCYMIPKVRGTR